MYFKIHCFCSLKIIVNISSSHFNVYAFSAFLYIVTVLNVLHNYTAVCMSNNVFYHFTVDGYLGLFAVLQ